MCINHHRFLLQPACKLGALSVPVSSILQELLAIQQSDGPKNLGFFGTRNMGMTHQKLVEILSYAMVSTVRTALVCQSRGAGVSIGYCRCWPSQDNCTGQQLQQSGQQ